jgi:hypothetical protein
MILSLVARLTLWLRGCRGYEQRIQNVYDGRVAVLSRASDQAGEGGNLCASSQVHKGHPKKFKMDDSKPPLTLMSTTTVLDVDDDGKPVDQKEYWSMIGYLLYLTATRFQASPRTSHREAVKRIFRYLQYTPELDLWYFAFASWYFGCRLCGVLSPSEIDFGYLPVSRIFACFLVFSQTI